MDLTVVVDDRNSHDGVVVVVTRKAASLWDELRSDRERRRARTNPGRRRPVRLGRRGDRGHPFHITCGRVQSSLYRLTDSTRLPASGLVSPTQVLESVDT